MSGLTRGDKRLSICRDRSSGPSATRLANQVLAMVIVFDSVSTGRST